MPILCYAEHVPPPTLNRVVDAVWSVAVDPAGDATPQHWVLPDGCVSVSAHFRERLIDVQTRPASTVAFRRPCTPGEKIVGLRIRPGHRRSIDLAALARRLDGRFSPRSFADAERLCARRRRRCVRNRTLASASWSIGCETRRDPRPSASWRRRLV